MLKGAKEVVVPDHFGGGGEQGDADVCCGGTAGGRDNMAVNAGEGCWLCLRGVAAFGCDKNSNNNNSGYSPLS